MDVRQTLTTIRRVAEATQGDRQLADLLGRVCAEVAESFDFERVLIARLDESDDGGGATTVLATFGTGGAARTPAPGSAALDRARTTGRLVQAEDGAVVVPLRTGGGCIGFLVGDRQGCAFALDVTDVDLLETVGVLAASLLEKELGREDLRRLDAARAQFVAFASHELRTPIHAVYGVLATLHLRGGKLRAEQLVELRAAAYEQADRLKRLADQLLDLSRLDAAAVEVSPRPTHLRRLIEEVVLLVGQRDAPTVEISVDDDLEVEVDPVAVERIVSNLLTNAFRYGAPPVRVEAVRDDHRLRLHVVDAGRGVPPEFVPLLFDRFTRSASTTHAAEGSGLGLSIADSYARAHGGSIEYRDAEPHGACFEVSLPVAS